MAGFAIRDGTSIHEGQTDKRNYTYYEVFEAEPITIRDLEPSSVKKLKLMMSRFDPIDFCIGFY